MFHCSVFFFLKKRRKKTEKENSLALSKMLKCLYSWGLVMLDFKKPFRCKTCNRESNRCQRTPDTRQSDRTCSWMQQKGCWINAVGRVILPSPLVSLHRLPVNDSNQIKILVSSSRAPPSSDSSWYLWSSAPSRTAHQSPCQPLNTFPLDRISVGTKKIKIFNLLISFLIRRSFTVVLSIFSNSFIFYFLTIFIIKYLSAFT